MKNTVLDGLNAGFKVTVVPEAIRAVDVRPGDGARAIEEMKHRGARSIKGDYFGPLVLAGAIVLPENTGIIKRLGVADSKTLTDISMRTMIDEIRKRSVAIVRIIEPIEYNALYDRYGNLNILMQEEYIKLIRSFPSEKFQKVILDKFSQSEDQNRRIRKATVHPMDIEEKAEKHLPVAAASILARCAFTDWLESKAPGVAR